MSVNQTISFNNKKNTFWLLLITFVLVGPKWIFSFTLLPEEDFLLKVIHETVDILYYPLINNISDLNFKPLYLENENSYLNHQSDGIFSFPILNLVIPAIFWKLFGPLSFVILEFICVYLFLKIFQSLIINYTNNIYILISFPLLLFSLTFYIRLLGSFDFEYIKLIEANFTPFYNLRFPRPIINNLFLFYYIYLCHKIFILKNVKNKNFILLGITSGFSLHAFFYFFLIQNIFFILFFIYKNQKNLLNNIIENKRLLFSYFLIIFIFIILYLYNLSFSDPDYLSRMGIVNLNLSKKIILLEYYFGFLKNFLFAIILLLNIFIFFSSKKIFKFLTILFISAILSPLVFFIISNKVIDIYHFFNLILIIGAINITIFFLYFFNSLFINKIKNNVLNLFFIFVTIISINYYLINEDVFKSNFDYRNNVNEVIKTMENNKFKNKNTLVTDTKISVWLLMNDYKNFSYIPVNMWTTRSNEQLQKDFIKVIKFFNFKTDDYNEILQNKIYGQRMYNHVAINFLGRKYLANKLKTFNDSNDFKEMKFINNIKPSISHSFAIPRFEIINLVDKFKKFDDRLNSEILILSKNDDLFDIKKASFSSFCVFFENLQFTIYLKKTESNNCAS